MITVLEAGSLRSGCQHGQVRTPFLVKDFSLYPHIVEGDRALLGLFYKGTNPIHEGSTSCFPNIQIIAKPNPKSFSVYCGEWTVWLLNFLIQLLLSFHLSLKITQSFSLLLKWCLRGRSQDGGGIGRGDHFLFYKFIQRTTERWTKFTKQLLIVSSGHQAPRKAAHCLRREVGQKY